jgi:small subunit ribosomal protein S6e
MVEFKLTINDPKTGKSYKKVLESSLFKNKKIGQDISGDDFGFKGYKFEITGGSDNAGFPMRRDLEGSIRRKALLSKGVGMQKNRRGLRLRKTICGNTIKANISQINLKIKKYGAKKIEDILGIKKESEEKPAEEKKAEEKPKESKKDVIEKKEEVKENKKVEAKNEVKEEIPTNKDVQKK